VGVGLSRGGDVTESASGHVLESDRAAVRQRAKVALLACLGTFVVVPVLAVVVVAALVVGSLGGLLVLDWFPRARGVATREDFEPLPAGVQVVGDSGGALCGGNGDGWRSCERRLRVRLRSGTTTSEELQDRIAAHYRSHGHEMVAIAHGVAGHPMVRYGSPACEATEPEEQPLCLSVEPPVDLSYSLDAGKGLDHPPEPGEVDIVARSHTYLL
jgi:hypothetical protein